MHVSYFESLHRQKWIVFCASCCFCLAGTSASPLSQEAAICEGNILLQSSSSTGKSFGIHSSTAKTLDEADPSEGHDDSSEALPRATALRPFPSTPAEEAPKLEMIQVEIEVTRLQAVQHALSRAYERLLFNFAHGGAWNISIVALIVALGIFILCTVLNLQTGSRRTGLSIQGGTFGNQFGALPAAGLLAKPVKSTAQSKTRAAGRSFNDGTTLPRPPSSSGAESSVSSMRALCPGLIVPGNSDCVLVIRILPNIVEHETDIGDAAAGRPLASSRGALELDIFDLSGKPVLAASVVKPLPKQGNAVVTLRTLGAPHGGDSGCLTLCRVGSTESLEKCINIYGTDDALFGRISRDRSTSGYVLNSSRGELLLLFDGSFQEHRIHVLDSRHSLMAHTEPCKLPSEPEGDFYQARIATGVDVGLVLSGLLAIDTLEAEAQ